MCIGTPKTPSQPRYAAPKPPSNAADLARSEEERRRRAASGHSGTILTGAGGVTAEASTSAKTLLGQ